MRFNTQALVSSVRRLAPALIGLSTLLGYEVITVLAKNELQLQLILWVLVALASIGMLISGWFVWQQKGIQTAADKLATSPTPTMPIWVLLIPILLIAAV